MLAYGGVWWRMVEWLQFGDVGHATAVSLYPTIASFNTHRLPYTRIASLISHVGYAGPISPPSCPISTTSIDELYEAVCVCVCVFVCVYIYSYTYVYTYIALSLTFYIYIYIYMYTYIYIYILYINF
jgi:hypothetical protein